MKPIRLKLWALLPVKGRVKPRAVSTYATRDDARRLKSVGERVARVELREIRR